MGHGERRNWREVALLGPPAHVMLLFWEVLDENESVTILGMCNETYINSE